MNKTSNAGGIKLRIILAVSTLVILGAMVVGVTVSQREDAEANRRKAMRISDYGLQQALIRLSTEPSWRTGYEKTEYNEGWYKVTIATRDSVEQQILSVTSSGQCGFASRTQVAEMVLALDGDDTVWVQRSLHQE